MLAKAIVEEYTLLPSITGGIVRKDGTTTISNYGKIAENEDRMVSDQTHYTLASCTKSMTAAMIMKVCHTHGIRNPMKTITMGSVLPFVQPAYQNVTLDQLLCMVSGIVADKVLVQKRDFWRLFINNPADLRSQRRLLAEKVCGKDAPKPGFAPGTAYFYSNFAYVIAAHMIEVKFSMSYEDLMETYLFGPLRMQAYFTPPPMSAVGHSVVLDKYQSTWYDWWYKQILSPQTQKPAKKKIDKTTAYIVPFSLQYPPAVLAPAALVSIDMPSWLRYLHAVMMHDETFLPKKLWNILLNTGYPEKKWNPPLDIFDPPPTMSYSYGWLYITTPAFRDQEILFYTGSLPGEFTSDIILKQGQFALATVTNSSRAIIENPDSISLLPLQQLELALCPPQESSVQNLLKTVISTALQHPEPNAWMPKKSHGTVMRMRPGEVIAFHKRHTFAGKESFYSKQASNHISPQQPITALFLLLLVMAGGVLYGGGLVL